MEKAMLTIAGQISDDRMTTMPRFGRLDVGNTHTTAASSRKVVGKGERSM
jgi:hypothetical protein